MSTGVTLDVLTASGVTDKMSPAKTKNARGGQFWVSTGGQIWVVITNQADVAIMHLDFIDLIVVSVVRGRRYGAIVATGGKK